MAVGAAVALAATSGCSRADTETDSVAITFADNFSATHPIGRGGTQPFLQYLQEHGPDVGLDVTYFAAGQLGKQKDALTLLRSQAVHIAPVIPAYLANEIPLSSVGELPGLVEDPCVGIETLLPMTQEGGSLYTAEFEEQKVMPLWGVMIPGYEVFTSDAPVLSPHDLDGSLIRSPGGAGDRMVSGLGASPVSIAAPDLYEAVARQTVSGAVLPQLSVTSYSLQEVLGYSTLGANLSTTTVFYGVSTDLWHSLDEAQQNVLREASDIAQTGACQEMVTATETAESKIRDAGVEMIAITGDRQAEWDAALEPVRQKWVDDLSSAGLPAEDILTEFEQGVAEGSQ